MIHRIFTILALVLIFSLIAGCAEQTATDEIKIGVVASMTGPASTTGKDIWQSAVLAADEINAEGGVYVAEYNAKLPIKLILGDDESTREGGQKAVSKLITLDEVDLLVGGFSSAVTSAHQSIVAEHGVPYIITGASSPIITRRTDIETDTMFHFCPTTDDYGEQTMLFVDSEFRAALEEKFGFPADRPIRLAVIYQDSPYGKGVLDAVTHTIESQNLNIEIVAEESFQMGDSDFHTILTSVKSEHPDVVYPATFLNEQVPLVTQARRDVGLNTIFLAVECNDDADYYTGLGRFGEYSIIESRFSPYTVPKGPLEAAVPEFMENYQDRWGSLPSMMGASTYEGVYIAAQAIENAGTLDKVMVRNAIASLDMPQVVEPMQGSRITFTEDYREAKFELYMEQLIWDDSAAELRPKIIWPDSLKEEDLILPEWYEPGSE